MAHEHLGKIPGRKDENHKGDYGRVFVVAGSRGLTGAAYLTSMGALKAGSGLVTCGIPESLNTIMEIKLTEVMTRPLAETAGQSFSKKAKKDILEVLSKCDVLALGPGIGTEAETKELVKEILLEAKKPVVLDADGLNCLEGDVGVLTKRKSSTVITPHPGEMATLVGKEVSEIQADREEAAKSLAEVTGSVVCLKGHKTIIASPDGSVYVNATGNSGMATGGTGDVLTGMIASFIGQGVEEYSAAVSAVYLHGLAGDLAAERKSPFCMIASDILDNLGDALEREGM